jgi:hypothetical protein
MEEKKEISKDIYVLIRIKKSDIDVVGAFDTSENAKDVHDVCPDNHPDESTKTHKTEPGTTHETNDDGEIDYEKSGMEEENETPREKYSILIDEKLKENKWINFNGIRDNCKKYCKGWDGKSRRCHCQNRRVDWEYDSDNDIIEAVAF